MVRSKGNFLLNRLYFAHFKQADMLDIFKCFALQGLVTHFDFHLGCINQQLF